MQIPVLVERDNGNGYRACGKEPFAVSARGATREEALGSEIVGLEVSAEAHPWMEFAGMFKDDPWVDDWVASMAEHRRQVEADPNR